MRPNALRVMRCLRIFDKLESIHITLKLLEGSGRERETLGDIAQEGLVQSSRLSDIFVNQLFGAGIVGILIN